MKVYIDMNSRQAELIRFRKHVHVYFAKRRIQYNVAKPKANLYSCRQTVSMSLDTMNAALDWLM